MTAKDRAKLKELALLLIAHEKQVHYPRGDVRGPLDAATFKLSEAQMRSTLAHGGSLMMDCSQGVTCLYKWAGLQDPNGLGYRYAGYTGTLLEHLPHYSDPSKARVGALVVYGPGTGDHVSMVVEWGKNPLLWSHGFEGGPQLVRLATQRSYHRAPVTFLRVAGVGKV